MPTPEQRLRKLYGFDFPDDFFLFREFLARLPAGMLSKACDLRPAYPFTAAAGRPPKDFPAHPLWEDRFYHDLPEFVTLFLGSTDGLHWGYFFDSPGEHPPVVVHYWHSDTFEHTVDGDNVFEAVRLQVEVSDRDFQEMIEDDPDAADFYREQIGQLATVRDELARYWDPGRPETGEDYFDAYGGSGWRKPVAPTWSRLGVVAQSGKHRRLSREPLTVNPAKPGRTNTEAPAVIAALAAEALRLLERGFPCAALKLGHDLWVWAEDFPICYELLDTAYATLGREPLRRLAKEARALRAHYDGRRRKS